MAGGALSLLLAASPGAAEPTRPGDETAALTATLPDGTEIARLAVPPGGEWCVLWRHSVQGFEVADCYENRAGRMVLMRSHQPDFAAGLGHIPGRGTQVSDGAGGYWITGIDEPVPGDAYVLRAGSMAVDHRLSAGGATVSLSEHAARRRIRIALEPSP